MKHLLNIGFLAMAFLGTASTVAHAADTRPNILFIIFDDWSREHAGAYGCQWVKTPNFDRLAREGVLFKHAFTSNPKCSPCRASILTGRNTWQLEEASCHGGLFPSKFAVYPDLLEKAGYAVGLTGKGWGPGDFKSTGFKRNPSGPSFDEHKTDPPAGGIGKNDYARNFEAFLQQRDKQQPFCFWMGFTEPHRAYELNSGVRMGKKLEEIDVPPFLPDLPTVRGDLADYAIEVEYADSHIGRALELLERERQLDNTLVICTSDHGMPFPFVKGQIFDDGFHLPLAMRWGKGIKPGRVVEDFVNVRDLAPTYLELAGQRPHEQMTGRSLVNVLQSEKSGWVEEDRKVMLVGKERHDIGRPNDLGYPVRAIRTPDYFYVLNYHPDRWPACNPETDFGNCDPSPTKEVIKLLGGHFYELAFGKRPAEMLFRLSSDPRCVNNIAGDPAFAYTKERLREEMLSMLKEEQDPRALGNGHVFDTYQYLGARRKGYETWLAAQAERAAEAVSEAQQQQQQQRQQERRGRAQPK
jgi:arylsulfatase A-like enzyme